MTEVKAAAPIHKEPAHVEHPAVAEPHTEPLPDEAAERKKTDAELAAEKEANEPRDEKINRLIAAYAHGLASNAPRTSAELAELKSLLGHEEVKHEGAAHETAEADESASG